MRAYLFIGAALALAITPAMAGGKSGGGGHATTTQNHPQENISLSYGKVEHTYVEQKASRDAASGKARGKRSWNPNISISTPK